MPVEQIYAKLNRDTAASVVIPMGYHKGKTLGQLALEKPKALEWYMENQGEQETGEMPGGMELELDEGAMAGILSSLEAFKG